MTTSIRTTPAFGVTDTTAIPVDGFTKSLTERQPARTAEPLSVPEAFRGLFECLEPTDTERERASEQQQRVRKNLEGRLSLETTYLSGSYRRRTLIRPLDDIDLLVVLDGDALGITMDGRGATKALDLTLAALRAAYPNTEMVRYSRCIQMQFAGTGIGFDVVPVLQFTEHEFWMPDEHRGRWIRTNPREVQRMVSEANQGSCDGWLVPLVKLLKAWNDEHGVPVPGFRLEAMAYHALKTVPLDERVGIAFLFDQLSTAIRYTTPDIWPQGEPAGEMNAIDQLRVAEMLQRAASAARKAVAAEAAGNIHEAHSIWGSLFGDRYPGLAQSRGALERMSIPDALKTVASGGPFTATSAGLSHVAAGYARVKSSTSHGGRMDEASPGRIGLPRDVAAGHREYLEREIADALTQFPALRRIDPVDAASDPALWPVRGGSEHQLYAVLVGEQSTNFGNSRQVLVKIPKDMPATEPRIYMLRQHVDGVPRKGQSGVRFVAKRPIRHQWRDGAICSHSLRDHWDGRLVTALVHAADWLFRQENYLRTGRWIGHEIDSKGRHVINHAGYRTRRARGTD